MYKCDEKYGDPGSRSCTATPLCTSHTTLYLKIVVEHRPAVVMKAIESTTLQPLMDKDTQPRISTRPTYNAKAQEAEKQRRILRRVILAQWPIAERQQSHVYTEPSCEWLLNIAGLICAIS